MPRDPLYILAYIVVFIVLVVILLKALAYI